MTFTLKAAALTIVLGTTAFTALPAQAFSFDEEDFGVFCMTDYQIRNKIEDEGFDHIFLNVVDRDGEVQVKASMDGTVYLIDFDSCANEITDIEEL
jgi:hypothetical protein